MLVPDLRELQVEDLPDRLGGEVTKLNEMNAVFTRGFPMTTTKILFITALALGATVPAAAQTANSENTLKLDEGAARFEASIADQDNAGTSRTRL